MNDGVNVPTTPGRELLEFATTLRRDFHRHPELGLEEHRTQRVVTERLESFGLAPRRLGGTGVVATLDSGRSGRTLMLRADMDALPVTEETGAPYASTIPGLMHACGHDGHMAVLLTAARQLVEQGLESGTVHFAFQPGEEGFRGAQKMIDDGVLDDPRVDAAFGLHLWRDLHVGQIGVIDGPCMAAVDTFEITLTGVGGHAAMPQYAVDPVVMAAHVITALQSIVSREVDPVDAAVVTVASVEAGTGFNIIPPAAVLRGTCRTFTPAVRELVHRRVTEVAAGVAASLGGRAEVDYTEFLPATVNDSGMAALVREAAEAVVGPHNVVPINPSMGGEDMSLYLERVPGCFAFVGLRNDARDITYAHHHPRFDMDEDCLAVGVDLVLEVARRFLGSGGQ